MKNKIELLAPGGDIDSIKAAILAGADAIYCGLDKFNARDRAKNINFEKLNGILRLAHQHQCEIFLTLNIIIIETEFPAILNLLNKLVNTSIDGLIIQDFGLFYLLSKYYPSLKIHASTQLTTHNEGQIKFLSKLKATRVNLSRELTIDEVTDLTKVAHKQDVLTEVFVHGSNCVSFSGLCYMSSVNGGNSGNRGRCSQPCRDQYLTTAEGKDFPLNIKDNSAFSDLQFLSDAGVDSVKIEGRIKQYHYVYTVVNTWRKHLQSFYQQGKIDNDNSNLRKVFNRDLSDSFLQGKITRETFIDNPRDNSALYFSKQEHVKQELSKQALSKQALSDNIKEISFKPLSEIRQIDKQASDAHLAKAKKELYDVKTDIITEVKIGIEKLSIDKPALNILVSGRAGMPLKVSIEMHETSFTLYSESHLSVSVASQDNDDTLSKTHSKTISKNKKASPKYLNYELLFTRFKAINETEYYIDQLDLEHLEKNLIIPFKELTAIKKKILFRLNNSRKTFQPIHKSILKKAIHDEHTIKEIVPQLSVLISSVEDVDLCDKVNQDDKQTVNIYFELPNSFTKKLSFYVDLFLTQTKKESQEKQAKHLIPWFPAVLIGPDYHAAIEFLHRVQPKLIVTNNTGVAYEAYQQGIKWVAGPYLNIVNSFSLLCLKEEFNCCGAFISNEINKNQIKRINKPDDFDLYYSIYHPIVLMTSKACFFHQVTGCKKNLVDGSCIQKCEKSSLITNLKEVSYLIKKSKGNYHTIYNETNFLNTEIVNDLPSKFSNLMIDLRDIDTATKLENNKLPLIQLFQSYLGGDDSASKNIQECIYPSTNTQYLKGF
jgi:putative protease